MSTLNQETTLSVGAGSGLAATLPASRRRQAPRGVWRAGLLAATSATAANVLVYALARALGVTFAMPLQWISGVQPIVLPVEMVILGCVAGAAAATVAFALLGRFDPRHPRLFLIVGLAFLVLTFGGPLTLESTDNATRATLMLMHVVAGGSIIGLLYGSGRR